jgi:hypothetical protein
MSIDPFVEAELRRHDWAKLAAAQGHATEVPAALRELLSAKTPDDVNRAYWKLENSVVVQGQLYESAPHVVCVLMAALASSDRPSHVRIGVLELLFQMVNGFTHRSEEARGLSHLELTCRSVAKQGLWSLYRELYTPIGDGAFETIQLVEDDQRKLADLKRDAEEGNRRRISLDSHEGD